MNDLSFLAAQKKKPWQPIPNSSQALALDSRADVTFYHGARGPGKTDTQLMRFYRKVGRGYGHFWRGVIFDREYKQLGDLISKSRRWFGGFNDGARFLAATSDLKWVWPTGEELLFRAVKKPQDYWDYHGQEFPFIGWNELCKYPTPELFDQMQSINRTSFTPEKDNIDLPPLQLETFATANPYGPGHGWVKRKFIDPEGAREGKVIRTKVKVYDPGTQEDVWYEKTQVSIFGSYKENIYLPAAYVAYLEGQTDPNIRRAWLYGDWDIVAGGAFTDVWDRKTHVVPHFHVPESWRLDRSFDWGSTHPSATIWWAEADGTEATMRDGSKWCPPRGSLVGIAELYTADTSRTNVGLRLGASKIAEMVREREDALRWLKVIDEKHRIWPGPADNQINDRTNLDVDDIATIMSKKGIRWTESDKRPGSRKIGMQLVRDRLQFAKDWVKEGDSSGPGLFFTVNCPNTIATVPMLPRDETNVDDVDTDAEDHLYDAVRYRVLAGTNRWATSMRVQFPH